MSNPRPAPRAYWEQHCGNEDPATNCFGTALESYDDGTSSCPGCGLVYDCDEGRVVADGDGNPVD